MAQNPPPKYEPGNNGAGAAVAPETNLPGGIIPAGISHIERLQRALGKIDSHPNTHSAARAIISGYYRFLNPKLTLEHLPRSLRVHPADPERGVEGGHKYLVLYFHLGNAASALQDAYRLDLEYAMVDDKLGKQKRAAKELVEQAIVVLEYRTTLLEKLAADGPNQWVVSGTEATGFTLAEVP